MTRPCSACRSCGDLAPAVAPRQLGQRRRVVLAGDQRLDHGPARDAQHVGGDAGQLDVGVLQHLLDAVGHRGPVADQLGPLPRQVAQLADRRRRDEAGREQAVLEQLGDPLGVLDVGLAAGDLLDVLGVDQHHLEAALQQVEDRLPVDAGRFHGDVADALRPRASRPAPAGRRSWCRRCGPGELTAPSGPTRRTQATTVFLCTSSPAQQSMKDVHRSGSVTEVSPSRWGDLGARSSFLFVLPRGAGGDRVGFDVTSSRGRDQVCFRAESTKAQRRPHTQGRTPSRINPAHSIFMGWGAASGHDSSFRKFHFHGFVPRDPLSAPTTGFARSSGLSSLASLAGPASRGQARHPWIDPLACTASHTGARRSPCDDSPGRCCGRDSLAPPRRPNPRRIGVSCSPGCGTDGEQVVRDQPGLAAAGAIPRDARDLRIRELIRPGVADDLDDPPVADDPYPDTRDHTIMSLFDGAILCAAAVRRTPRTGEELASVSPSFHNVASNTPGRMTHGPEDALVAAPELRTPHGDPRPVPAVRPEPLEDRTLLSVSILNHSGQGYPGLSFNQSGGYVPPDTNGAAGPSVYVESVNQSLAIYNPKATGASAVTDSLSHLLFTTGRPYSSRLWVRSLRPLVDLRRTDRPLHRWRPGCGFQHPRHAFDLAVSRSNNPTTLSTADWDFYKITTTERGFDADYPGNFGYNHDALVFTLNMFGVGGGGHTSRSSR